MSRLGIGTGSGWSACALYPLAPHFAFALGGVVALGVSGRRLVRTAAPEGVAEEQTSDFAALFWANFLSYGSAWTQGVLEAEGMFTVSVQAIC